MIVNILIGIIGLVVGLCTLFIMADSTGLGGRYNPYEPDENFNPKPPKPMNPDLHK